MNRSDFITVGEDDGACEIVPIDLYFYHKMSQNI